MTLNGKNRLIKNILNNIDKCGDKMAQNTFSQQFIIGATTGWLTGVITVKLGKTVAFTFGGVVLLMQIAHHNGYISFDLKQMLDKSKEKQQQLNKQFGGESTNEFVVKIKNFSAKNRVFTSSFIGGFLIGIAW